MYIQIYGKKYKLKQDLIVPAKLIVSDILQDAKKKTESRNLPDLYKAIVIMMYVTSAGILQELSAQDLSQLREEKAEKKEQKKE